MVFSPSSRVCPPCRAVGLSRVGTQLSTSVCGDENCWLPEAVVTQDKADSPQDPSHHPSLLLDLFFVVVNLSVISTPWTPARLLCPRDSPDKHTRVGCPALLQGIFPTQGSNPGLPHCRWIFLPFQLTGKPHLCYNVMISFLFIAEYNTML